jgi:hypothetical protein
MDIANEEDACVAAQKLGFPVVLKARSTEVLHRSSAGLVRPGLTDEASLRAAVRELQVALPEVVMGAGTLVLQEQVPGGVELLVGATEDRTFGMTMVVASGGVFAELIDDAQTFLPPISAEHAASLVRRLRALQVRPPGPSLDALIDTAARAVSRISLLVADNAHEVTEADFNPIILTTTLLGESRAVAVDWLLLAQRAVD